jgi:hypothetical protein
MIKQSFIVSIFAMIIAGGCASISPQSPEEQVLTRAQARLDALMAKDFGKSYEFLSPGYRGANSLNRYKALYLGAGNWTFAKVDEVTCDDAALCEVRVNIKYTTLHAKTEMPSQLTEKWIFVDDKWWLYLK